MQLAIFKEALCEKVHGITIIDAHKQGICVECRAEVHDSNKVGLRPGGVYSESGCIEYGISGLCEFCFDNLFS